MVKKKEATIKSSPAKKTIVKPAPKKKAVKKVVAKPVEAKPAIEITKTEPIAVKYICAVGRRKEAVARVRIFEEGSGKITINNRDLKVYFPIFQLADLILAPLKLTGQADKLDISIKVLGGGKQGQAEAGRHGLSRALVKLKPEFKPTLKKVGFLTRDARVKERKKFGLKKARKAPQWAKR